MNTVNYFDIGVIIFIALSAVIMAVYFFATRRPVKSALIGAGSGIGALLCAKIISAYAGFCVSVNIFTLLISAILGIPGAACTVILNVVFGTSV